MLSLVEEQLNIIDIVDERGDDIKIYKDFYENPKLTKPQQKYNKEFLINIFNNRMLYCSPKEYKEYIKLFVDLFVLNNDFEIKDDVSNFYEKNYTKTVFGYIVIDKLTNIELCEIHTNLDDYVSSVGVNDNELRFEYMMEFYNNGGYYRDQKITEYSFKPRISGFDENDEFKGIKEIKNKIITYMSIQNYQSFTFERLTEILENDDVDALIKILSKPIENISDKFVVHVRNCCDNEKYINLVELIVVYGAVKCFKYLILNKYLDEYLNKFGKRVLMQFIIISNNYEILHLFENNYPQVQWHDNINTVICYHRNEFLFYMLNNCEDQQEIFNHNSINYIFGYCLSNYNYKALLTLLNETEKNKPISISYAESATYKYIIPFSVYILDKYNFPLFSDWSYIVEFLFDGTYEIDFIKRVLYSVEIKDMEKLEYNGYPPDSFIRAFSTCIINDVPDDYIKLLKSIYYGKEFLTINELNNIKLSVILNKILNRKPKIKQINYNKFISHIVPEIVYYSSYTLRDILNIINKSENYVIKGLKEIVKEYIRRMAI